MIFTIEDILKGCPAPVCISPDKSAADAIALMTEHDFSQLPVVMADRKPVGIITSDSLLRAAHNFGVLLTDLRVRDAFEAVRPMRIDEELFDLLDQVQRNSVLIVDANGALTGIVTHYDTAAYFRGRAEDMMVVEDIETTLKEYITTLYGRQGENGEDLSSLINEVANTFRKFRRKYETALRAYFKRVGAPVRIADDAIDDSFKCFGLRDQAKELEDLTIEEMTDLLLRHPESPKSGAQNDPSGLRQLLSDVRETRNILAHFRGEISTHQREQLKFCSNWLSRALKELVMARDPQATNAGSKEQHESTVVRSGQEGAGRESTYVAISRELKRVPPGQVEIKYPFSEIEAMIGRELPASARKHRAWWANDRHHVHARQWLDAGWRVKTVVDEFVMFSRAGV